MVSLASCVLVMEMNEKMVAHLTAVVLIVLWYGSSSMFSVYSKRVISVMDEQAGHETATFYTGNFFGSNAPGAEEWEFMPRSSCIVALLTALQSGCGLAVYAAFKGLLVASGRQPPQIEPLRELAWQCRWVGLLYFSGNLSTNLTLAFTKVTAAQCLKAAEPLFVVGAMRALAPKKFAEQINSSVLASLLLVVAGVGLSSFSPALSIAGVLTAACANTGFAVSSVLAKSIQKSSVSTLDIFGLSMAWGTAAGFLTVLVVGVVTRTLPASALGWDGLKSGIAYGLYNCFSFAILARVTNPTHAVLKVGKRVAALVVAGLLLGDDLEIRQWFGVGLAVLGAIFYQSGKSGSKQSPLKGACAAMAVVTVGLSISRFNNVDIIDANSTRIFIGANITSCNLSREKHNAVHAQGAGGGSLCQNLLASATSFQTWGKKPPESTSVNARSHVLHAAGANPSLSQMGNAISTTTTTTPAKRANITTATVIAKAQPGCAKCTRCGSTRELGCAPRQGLKAQWSR